MENLDVYKYWGLGFVEEVLNGSVYQPSGVCPHQCWSETMVLQPAIEGMLGLNVNASDQRIGLAPSFPADWDSVTVQHIRVGNRSLTFRMARTAGKYFFTFQADPGSPLQVDFSPAFPAGTKFGMMSASGKNVPFSSIHDFQGASIFATLQVTGDLTLELDYSYGISVLAAVPSPRPGYPAAGFRILSAGLSGDQYQVRVQGPAGSSGEMRVYCNGLMPGNIENGNLAGTSGNCYTIKVNFEPGDDRYPEKTVSIDLIKK